MLSTPEFPAFYDVHGVIEYENKDGAIFYALSWLAWDSVKKNQAMCYGYIDDATEIIKLTHPKPEPEPEPDAFITPWAFEEIGACCK